MWLDLNQIWACQPHPTGERRQVFAVAYNVRSRAATLDLFVTSGFLFLSGNVASHALVSFLLFFLLFNLLFFFFFKANLPPCRSLGRGRSLISATTRFLDSNGSRQISCLRSCGGGPMGCLAQQAAHCQDTAAAQHWKNQSARTPHIVLCAQVLQLVAPGRTAVGALKSRPC